MRVNKKQLTDFKKLIKEWNYKRNNSLKPEQFSIGSGKKVMISDIIKIISKKTNKIYKIEYERKKQTCLVADIKKLKKLNWKPTQNIKNIIYNLI